MNFLDCLEKSKKLTPAQMKRITNLYNEQHDMRVISGQTADAAVHAARAAATIEANRIAQKRINLQRDAVTMQTFWKKANENYTKKLSDWNKAIGDSKFKKLAIDNPVTSWFAEKPTIDHELEKLLGNMDYRTSAVKNMYLYEMRDALEVMRPDQMLGTSTSKERQDFIKQVWRAAGGENIEGAAGEAGKKVRKVFDDMHAMYKKKGGIIGEIENWMPQLHNSKAIQIAGKDKWKDFVKSRLDWNKITDDYGTPIPLNKREDFLNNVYDTLSTDGANELVEKGKAGGSRAGGKSYASRRDQSRVLHFLSPEAQFDYNKQFGSDDLFLTIMNHVDKMSRDIAILDTMGNPETFMANANLRMANDGGVKPFTEKMYAVAMGRTAMTGAESELYKFTVGTQAWLRGVQLGAAPISAISDTVFVAYRSALAGNKAMDAVTEYIQRLIPPLKSGDPKAKAELELMAYNMESMMGNILRRVNEGENYVSQGKTRADKWMARGQNFSTGIMRVSGLSHMTQAAKDAVTMPMFQKVAANSDVAWKDLDPEFKATMEDIGGVTEADWAIIQKAEKTHVKGDVYVTLPSSVKDIEARMRYSTFIEGVRRMAANEPTIKTRAVATQGQEAGSATRFLLNSAFMYKSFPITMLNHYMRPAIHRAMVHGKGDELAALSAALLGMGYATLIIKDALRNKTPRDPMSLNTWRQAALQSGALSVFDFALKDGQNRMGQDLQRAMLGPLVNAGIDTYDALDSIASFYANSDDYLETIGDKGAAWLRRYNPGATLWWLNLGVNVTMGDTLNKAIEGDAYYRRRRRDEKVMQEQGQEYIFE